jgi:hypothetical protein
MSQIVYSNCSTLSTSGCYLYTNSSLTTPVSNGKYSDGTTCFTVSGGNGQITASENCVVTYSISLYGRFGTTPNDNNVDIYYSTDNGSTWIGSVAAITTESCDYLGYFDTTASSVLFSIRNNGTDPIYYNARTSPASCPNNTGVYCETATAFNVNLSGNVSVYFTVYVDGIGEFLGC